jgi:broad specificity phosphatase PhoE
MTAGSSSSLDHRENHKNVLQIYPLECYEELLDEQQLQQQEPQQSSSSSNSNSMRMIETIHRIHIVRHAEGYHNVEKDYKTQKNRDARLTPKGTDQCAALAHYVRDHYHQLFYHQEPPPPPPDDTKGSSSSGPLPSSSSGPSPSSSTTTTKSSRRSTNILVVTSTLTRCIQTALLAFPDLAATATNVPFVAHEGIRETVNYECDVRRSLSTLAKEFPRIDFQTAVGFPTSISSTSCEATTNGNDKSDDDNDDDDTDDPIWNAYRQRFGMDYDGPCESAELHVVARRGYHFFQWLVQHYNNNNDNTTSKRITDVILCTHSAFLRCILSWNQVGGVPQQMAQTLDDRTDDEKRKDSFQLFEYCPTTTTRTTTTTTSNSSTTSSSDQSTVEIGGDVSAFEASMRKDYENCEMRSFCLVQRRRG